MSLGGTLSTVNSTAAKVSAVAAVANTLANPACTPTLDVPAGASASLGGLLNSALGSIEGTAAAGLQSLEDNITGAVTAEAGAILGEINLLSMNLQSILSAFEAGGVSVGVPFTLGPSLGNIESIVMGLVNQVIQTAEQDIISAATNAINGAIMSAVNAITNLAVGELQKDLGPLLAALQAINGVLGHIEAEKMLIQQVLTNATSCPAKAEIMVEVYFKGGAK